MRLLLHHLAKLLEVLVLTEEVEIAQATRGAARARASATRARASATKTSGSCGRGSGTWPRSGTGRRPGRSATRSRPATTSSSLSGGFKEVDGLVVRSVARVRLRGSGRRGDVAGGLRSRHGAGSGRRGGWPSFLLHAGGDSLQLIRRPYLTTRSVTELSLHLAGIPRPGLG